MASHHPGKTLYDEFLQPRNLSQNRLARVIEVPPRRINEIVLGKRAITADTAVRLARYFNNDPAYWMKLQTDYDIALATNSIGIHLYTISADGAAMTGPVQTGDTTTPVNGIKRNRNIRRRLLR